MAVAGFFYVQQRYMREQNRVKRKWSQTKRQRKRASALRDNLAPSPWNRSHERLVERGIGPYESRYDVSDGYCSERSILLP